MARVYARLKNGRRLSRRLGLETVTATTKVDPDEVLEAMDEDVGAFVYYDGEYRGDGGFHDDLIAEVTGDDEDLREAVRAVHYHGWAEDLRRVDPDAVYFDGRRCTLPDGRRVAVIAWYSLVGVTPEEAGRLLRQVSAGDDAVCLETDRCEYEVVAPKSRGRRVRRQAGYQTAFVYCGGELEYGDVHEEAIELLAKGDEDLEAALTAAHWKGDFSGLPEGTAYFDGYLEDEFAEDDVDFLEPTSVCFVFSNSIGGLSPAEAAEEARRSTNVDEVRVISERKSKRRTRA